MGKNKVEDHLNVEGYRQFYKKNKNVNLWSMNIKKTDQRYFCSL